MEYDSGVISMKSGKRFMELNMFATISFTLLLALILWMLTRITEKVLAIRQSQREKGEKPIVYL